MSESPYLIEGRRAAIGGWFRPSFAITEQGLVCGAGSTLVRMSTEQNGTSFLSLDTDAGRLLAMLSASFGRPVAATEVLPHVEAASSYWRNGEKALANFRLMFGNLPKLRNRLDADRLLLAEYVLDQGLSPDALAKALGLAPISVTLRKYREDEPRVPAGNGRESGRWTDNPSDAAGGAKPIVLAEDDHQEEDENSTKHAVRPVEPRASKIWNTAAEARYVPRCRLARDHLLGCRSRQVQPHVPARLNSYKRTRMAKKTDVTRVVLWIRAHRTECSFATISLQPLFSNLMKSSIITRIVKRAAVAKVAS